MRIFRCACGNQVYFENTKCYACGRALGFLPEHLTLSAIEPVGEQWQALAPVASGTLWRMCHNYTYEQVCNWMVAGESGYTFCDACRLNKTIPNLSSSWNRLLWSRIESGKRRLVYDLLNHELPFASKIDDPQSGLAFQFLESPDPFGEFAADGTDGRVMTGHAHGVITINIAEADDVAREQMRVQMNEAYRTLLGHFRHESGHYFWDQLVRDDPEMLTEYRAVFGDERIDYAGALERHYIEGAPSDWWDRHISKYASSHPWEDWGETWAHYLQMTDALETALAVGLTARDQRGKAVPQADPESVEFFGAAVRRDFDEMLSDWLSLTVALNSINRSLGLGDAYPFALSSVAADKLRFVHRVVSRGISP